MTEVGYSTGGDRKRSSRNRVKRKSRSFTSVIVTETPSHYLPLQYFSLHIIRHGRSTQEGLRRQERTGEVYSPIPSCHSHRADRHPSPCSLQDEACVSIPRKYVQTVANPAVLSAFVTFLTAGFPTHDATVPLMLALEAGGADIIELGVPFSDPIADGPTIQAANTVCRI